jgi:hypothetical protein
MEISRMLNQMCHETLADADVKAIRKARGFSQKEAASRASFESFFLSSIGLEAVMDTLSDEEIATLHLLSHQTDEVDVTFFERLYGSQRGDEKYYYGTFTQQYRPTFDDVKLNLVRKGVLLMVEAKLRGDSVQMERWRYRFPPEFVPYLPPLIRHSHKSQAQGEINHEIIRKKVLEIANGPNVPCSLPAEPYAFSLSGGTLHLGKQPFKADKIKEWQAAAWHAALFLLLPNDNTTLSPEEAVPAILKTLQPDAWVTPNQLEPLLKVFCFGTKLPDAEKICAAGWHWGLLERYREGVSTFYRLPVAAPEQAAPEQYLTPDPTGKSALIDLRRIPLGDLELLNRLTRLDVQINNLIAFPDPIKLGRAHAGQRQSALGAWLRHHVSGFEQAFLYIEEKWGKTLVHLNLRVARVRDLSLRVQLERDLKGDLLVLSDQFVAFPAARANDVEKSVKKAGFVVKVVRP